MACYVIGDVHGCYDEFQQLLKEINYSPANDKILFTGDLVGRGRQSLEVIRGIKKLQEKYEVVVVLGNHDLHLIAFSLGNFIALQHPDSNFDKLLAAPDCAQLIDWLRYQPLAHYESSHQCLLVHAGIPPLWSFRKALNNAVEMETILRLPRPKLKRIIGSLYSNYPSQWDEDLLGSARLRLITNYLTRMRLCNRQSRLLLEYTGLPRKNKYLDYRPWFEFPRKDEGIILFGHWAAINGVTHQRDRIALDYGCVWGRHLAARRLEDGKIFTTPAIETLWR